MSRYQQGRPRSAEYRALMAAIGVVCALGAVSAVVPVVEHVVGAVLVTAALVWLAVVVTRRELRIRARLADIDRTHPAGFPPGLRAGPGAHAPVPPASTSTARSVRTVTPTGGAR